MSAPRPHPAPPSTAAPNGAIEGALDRRAFLRTAATAGGALALGGPLACSPRAAGEAGGTPTPTTPTTPTTPPRAATAATAPIAPFELDGLSVAELQEGMGGGRWTARSLVEAYLGRIAEIDGSGPTLRSVIETNPDALAIADTLDAERRAGRVRGPLHGVPVLVKDNIDSGDRMLTTAGSLALAGAPAARDAFLVARLRDAGAVLLGKTNLSEWANFRSTRSSSGWSARGGQCRNAHVLDRSPCGSSSGSGVAVAASLCAVAVGTETDGSVVCPSSASGIVGIKPTLGLVSRTGIVPIAHSQDTAGPMGRTVADAAALLTAMAGPDPADPASGDAARHATDYTTFLDPGALRGARIGALGEPFTGYSPDADRLFADAIVALRDAGAEVVEDIVLPEAREYGGDEYTVLLHEFRHDLAAYLATRPGVAIRTLADAIAFNEAHADEELRWFGQEIFLQAEQKGGLDSPEYREALDRAKRLAGPAGIDAVISSHRLDAIIAPTDAPAWPIDLINGDHYLGGASTPAAVAGYPHVTVPMGMAFGLPVGLSFFAGAWTEPRLIALAHAFEHATRHRRAPAFLRSVES